LRDVVEFKKTVDEEYALFDALFHRTVQFTFDYPQISIKDTLQCLEHFDRIEPISSKCGVMLSKCTFNDSYQKNCCVESIVFSMLYNSELVVPSTERDKQLKAKTKEREK
jgi:hypothetical protein